MDVLRYIDLCRGMGEVIVGVLGSALTTSAVFVHLSNSSKDSKGLCMNLLQHQYPSLQLYIPQVYSFSVMQVIRNQFSNSFCKLILIPLPTRYHFWKKPNWLPLQNVRRIEVGEYLSIPCDLYLLKPVYNREEQNSSVLVYELKELICLFATKMSTVQTKSKVERKSLVVYQRAAKQLYSWIIHMAYVKMEPGKWKRKGYYLFILLKNSTCKWKSKWSLNCSPIIFYLCFKINKIKLINQFYWIYLKFWKEISLIKNFDADTRFL